MQMNQEFANKKLIQSIRIRESNCERIGGNTYVNFSAFTYDIYSSRSFLYDDIAFKYYSNEFVVRSNDQGISPLVQIRPVISYVMIFFNV